RHFLDGSAADGLQAVTAVAAFHSSDALTPYLGIRARTPGFSTAHLDDLLWERTALWRLHAMRRTLFLVPTSPAPTFFAGASAEVARKERERLVSWLMPDMGNEERARAWVVAAGNEVMEFLESEGGDWLVPVLT